MGTGSVTGAGGAAAGGGGELMLALLADARLPTGGHTQSAGLEPALRDGLDPAEVPDYLIARLRTVVRVEAGVAVVARHAARLATGAPGAQTEAAGLLDRLWGEWAARTPSPASRAVSRQLGRGQRRLLTRLWPGHPGVRALDDAAARRPRELAHPPRAVVVGVMAACAGLSAQQTVRLVGYEDVQTVAAASLKLAPVDPVLVTGWAIRAQPGIERLVGELAGLTRPQDVPGAGAPLVEHWAEAHARRTERLFSA